MITSFFDTETAKVAGGTFSKRLPQDIQPIARRKLQQLSAAVNLQDLKVPPGNKLEPLKGNRAGQHSIRINGQWRICFIWNGGNAEQVEICDYH